MRCVGTLEFLCDFHEMCHKTQNNLEGTPTLMCRNSLENDSESDKENSSPIKQGKRKGKPELMKIISNGENEDNIFRECLHETLSQAIVSQNQNENILCDHVVNNVRNNSQLELSRGSCRDNVDKDPDSPIVYSNSEIINADKTKKSDEKNDSIIPEKLTSINTDKTANDNCPTQLLPLDVERHEIRNGCNESTISTGNTLINLPSNNNDDSILMYHEIVSHLPNESSLLPVHVETIPTDVLFERDSIIETQIVKDMIWITNDSQIPEPQKPKRNTQDCITSSPPPGDEAVKLVSNNCLSKDSEEMPFSSMEEIILLELQQVPAKENLEKCESSVQISRKRRRSSNNSDSTISEAKYMKMSELMTEEQKQIIETYYKVDMSVIDEVKVNNEIEVLDRNKFKCKLCDILYPRLDKCQVHIWRHLNMQPYLCKACDYSTLTVSNIRCHIRKSHLKIKPFECHICKKSYTSASQLDEHLNTHTGIRPFECSHCKFASTSKQVLAHHLLTHKSEKDISCDICGKKFYSKGRMRAHRIIHNKEKAFKCTLCSTYVLHKEALDKHYENVHSRDYKCKVCNKVYKSGKALRNHENVHGEAKYKCSLCPNIYKSSHILKEHILKHQGIRQYKCNHCDKSFAQQSHLAAHMAVHSGVTYNCPGCNKGFNRHDNMKVHANRCDLFLANPDLKELLIKRKISHSKNDTTRMNSQQSIIQSEEEKSIEEEKGVKKSPYQTVKNNKRNRRSVINERSKPDKRNSNDTQKMFNGVGIVEKTLTRDQF